MISGQSTNPLRKAYTLQKDRKGKESEEIIFSSVTEFETKPTQPTKQNHKIFCKLPH